MGIKYIVKLTEYEREHLLWQAGMEKSRQQTRYAQVLLALDQSQNRVVSAYAHIGRACGVDKSTVTQIAKRFVAGGHNAALMRKEQANRYRKVDGDVKANIIALARSEAPDGRDRWTLQLLADELVRLGVIENISHTAVSDTLKRSNLRLNCAEGPPESAINL